MSSSEHLNETINNLNKTIINLNKTIKKKEKENEDLSQGIVNLNLEISRWRVLVETYNVMKELDDERKKEEKELDDERKKEEKDELLAKKCAELEEQNKKNEKTQTQKQQSIIETGYNPMIQSIIKEIADKPLKLKVNNSSRGGKTNKKIKSKRRHTKKRF
jgi:chromosome segregation ATPase